MMVVGDGSGKSTSHISTIFGFVKKYYGFAALVIMAVAIQAAVLLRDRAVLLQDRVTALERENALLHQNGAESGFQRQAKGSPRILSLRERVIIPNGTWVEANGRYAYMQQNPDGSYYSERLQPGRARKMLRGRWVYLWGDSTMRQLFAALANELSPEVYNFTNSQDTKRLFRESPSQRGRKTYIPFAADPTLCYENEHTWTLLLPPSGGPSAITLTFNWKHFIDEEYDEYFFRHELKSLIAKRGRLPDVIVISTGLHNLWHFGETARWENSRDLESLLRRVSNATREYDLPPIVWIDNPRVVGRPGCPKAAKRYNKAFRWRILREMEEEGHLGALVTRERLLWTAPEEFREDGSRIHFDHAVQLEILPFLLRAVRSVGVYNDKCKKCLKSGEEQRSRVEEV